MFPFFLWFSSPLPVTVNKPQPLCPRQHTKYTSHDEAPSAPSVWTSERHAEVKLWSQEKPPKGLLSIFHLFSEAWQRAQTSRQVSGLALRPAPGSAGWAWTDELVSLPVSHCFCSFIFTFTHFVIFVSFCQWASGVGGSDRCNPASPAEAGSAERAGEVGRQDGGEGSPDHEAPKTPADSAYTITQ